ncbi:glycosyltransferase family 2 protein [Marinobacter salicampi]|uniref:glycosyltransferase family 2 protein n=1 Tax=Marinobacter salicampi TaxID=435907 RepID=UPI00140CF5F3|nr:glycosyltransferase family 2 protein [Marinobacter salicampi]
MLQPLVSIIVVSYNTREMTLACLRSVFAETHSFEFEVLVLDNASEDGSASAIEADFGDRVRLIAKKTNLGFAAGNNVAAKQAAGEYLLLLNPDTVVLDNAVDKLLSFARSRPDAGIWGGRTVFSDGALNPGSCWSRQTLWSLASQMSGLSSVFRKNSMCNPEGMGSWNREGVRYVDIVSGCFLLIKRELWLQLGGFREEFFMYGEDADLCLRAHKLGSRPIITGSSTIVHYGGASETVHADKLVRLLKAKMLLIQTHFPGYSRWLGRRLLALWPLSRFWAYSLLSQVGRSFTVRRSMWGDVWRRRSEWSDGRVELHELKHTN